MNALDKAVERASRLSPLERQLRDALQMAVGVINDFLPNIGTCALQDYGALNRVLVAAPAALTAAAEIENKRAQGKD